MMSENRQGDLPHIPELAEEYDLVRELGRGGTAVVYLARDRELGRDVAVKLIRPSFVQDEDAVQRLVREARTVGKLQHPNIVMLLGTRRLSDGGLALILQYVPGRSLKDRIRADGPLPFEDCETILRDLAGALAFAHRSRIVHRDLKPENVYLDETLGIARLADFGIARAWDSDSGLTLPGTAIGTPTYMSPEQVDGRELDGRSDIYSLGLLGYELLTGKQPWEGESLYAVIYKQKHEDLPPLEEMRPGVPENLRVAIAGAVRKDPNDRWKNAEAFLAALSGELAEPGTPGSAAGSRDASGSVPPAMAGVPFPSAGDPLPPEAVGAAPVQGSVGAPPARRISKQGSRRVRLVGIGVVALALLVVAGLAVASPDDGVRGLFGTLNPWASDAGPVWDDRAWARDDGPGTGEGGAPATGDPFGDDNFTDGIGQFDPMDPMDPGALAGQTSASPGTGGLAILQGNRQTGTPGTALASPLILRLVDEDGTAIPGQQVVFEVTDGGGSVEPGVDRTRPDGSVLAWWTLGSSGQQRVRARVEGMDNAAAEFQAVISTGSTPSSLQFVSGESLEGEVGAPLPGPVAVRVLDSRGVAMPGVAVRFDPGDGSGSANPAVVETDAEGVARTTWTLGSGTGTQELAARVASRPQLLARFEASPRAASLAVRPALAVGGTHACSLRSNGTLTCWGGNESGQLGDGSRARRVSPSNDVRGGPFAVVAAGVSHMCGLTSGGAAQCWGANDQGQAGGGAGAPLSEPRPVSGAPAFAGIAVGLGHSCGRTSGGAVYCWGANGSGQLGDGSTSRRDTPTRVAGNQSFRSIAAGWQHTCGLDASGRAYCWGNGGEGRLGTGGVGGSSRPQPVLGGHQFQRLAAGNAHTCGLTTNNRILCWGSNEFGQLGTGSTDRALTPEPIELDEAFSEVAAGGVHTCGVAAGGAALCWGRNHYGQVGDGTTQDRLSPTRVAGSARFSELRSLGSHNCGRTAAGDVLCWGYNVEGQLGDGTRQNRSTPVAIAGARP
ncbi:MAG: hypothetical protein EA350_09705 [Gemmatimonadales bacterium]|nr:MAG: hypothetical protein EA350_09705 [Gemmatimonadales bacterium]